MPFDANAAIDDYIIIDAFAGGGGASTGIELALGRAPDIAINHDADAIAMHEANHPLTRHYITDVWDVRPRDLAAGRRVAMMWFSPDCFPAGTMVLTREGYRSIEEIAVGDEVLTHRGRWRKVTTTMTSHKPLMKIRGHGHPGLLVSAEHPFYARTTSARTTGEPYWQNAKDLVPGKMSWASPLAFPSSVVPPVDGRGMAPDERLLWLAGMYVADGWTRLTETRAELVITCGRHEIAERREQLSAWPRAGDRAGEGELAFHERETGTAHQFSTNHRGLVKWLREHFGHGAASKVLPGWLLGLSQTERKAFLDGYLAGDGAEVETRGTMIVQATTVSKALAFGLKALAASLGFSPSVYRRDNQPDVIEGRKVNVLPAWSVRWRPEAKKKHTFVDGVHLWAPIHEVSDNVFDGEDVEVYNLSVDEDESYVVDGIVVHNCTHHSRARGGKPRDTGRRALADIIPRWCRELHPDVFFMENVEEWLQWGPLDDNDKPIKGREGECFRAWLAEIVELGYVVEWKVMKACDYGAPTIRKRLFLVARRDSQPIVWPAATHGKAPLLPFRTAAECIDWHEPVCSIFATREEAKAWAKRHNRGIPVRPLAPKTLARIARGVEKFVFNDADPFIVPVTHSGDLGRVHSIREPMRTVTTANGGELALAVPMIIPTGFGERPTQAPRIHDIKDPLTTVLAGGAKQNLCLAFLAKHFTGVTGIPMSKPMGAVTTWDHHSLVTASMQLTLRNNADCKDMREPISTITAGGGHIAEVRAFMIEYYGNGESRSPKAPMATVTTHDRFGIVTVAGADYKLFDIGMRMLTPPELARAQGFPDDYRLDMGDGLALSKAQQIHMIGNSVSPPMAAAIVAANTPRHSLTRRAA